MLFFWTFIITCFFSFGVQSLFYFWYQVHNPKLIKNYQVVFQYMSGVIGDGLLVPLMNVFAIETLLNVYEVPSIQLVLYSFLGGLIVTFLFHFYQEYFDLTNWTMPISGEWNGLGFYHAFFMFFESSFLCFTIIAFISANGMNSIIRSPIMNGLLIFFIFALTFFYDYRESFFNPVFLYAKNKFSNLADYF